jgi:nucleoside-diphosphate-sugar epimerase
MKILITGASGKLGGVLAAQFAPDHELVYLDRAPSDHLPAGTTYAMDLTKPEVLDEIFAKEKPEAVIHLAAILGPVCEQNPELAKQINVDGTVALAEMAIKYGARKFVFASTGAVYRQKMMEPTDERHNIDPQSVYGRTKYEAEQALAALAVQNPGIKFVTLRMFNIYGPVFSDSLVYKLIHSTPETPQSLFGLENFVRDYIHVDDVAKAFDLALTHDAHGVYNIASGTPTSSAELVDQLKAKGVTPHYNDAPGNPTYSWADITRAKEELGFKPRLEIIVDK